MPMRTVILQVIACAAGCALTIRSTGQLVLTTAPASGDFSTIHHTSLGADGGALLAYGKQGEPGLTIQRFSSEGQVLWSKTLIHPNAGNWYRSTYMDDGQGGLWCGVLSNEGHDLLTGITTSHIHLCHVDASGSLIGAWSHARTWTTPEFPITELTALDMALLPDGGLILKVIGSTQSLADFLDVLKFQSNGNMDWARNIGDVPALEQEGIPFNLSPIASSVTRPVVSSDGSITLGLDHGGFATQTLVQINPFGEITWKRQHAYTNSSYYGELRDIGVDDQDRIHVVGRLSLPTGQFLILPVYQSDGTWLRTDLCTITEYQSYTVGSAMVIGPGDRRTILNSGTKWATTVIPSLGSATATHRHSTIVTEGSENVTHSWTKLATHNGMLLRAGVQRRQHNILAYTTNAPALALEPIDTFASCSDSVSTSAMVEVPASILDLSEPELHIADIGSWLEGPHSSPWALEEGPVPITTPACAIPTGVDPLDRTSWTTTTMVRSGEPIELTEAHTGVVDVLSMTGAVVYSLRLAGAQSIPTAGWSPGSYLLRSANLGGHEVRMARLLVIDER